MAKFSKKVMGKEVGSAAVYAEPHTMSGKTTVKSGRPVPSGEKTTPTRVNGPQPFTTDSYKNAVTKPGNGVDSVNMSVGGYTKKNDQPVNKHGEMKIRGTGAATKGVMARGPMA